MMATQVLGLVTILGAVALVSASHMSITVKTLDADSSCGTNDDVSIRFLVDDELELFSEWLPLDPAQGYFAPGAVDTFTLLDGPKNKPLHAEILVDGEDQWYIKRIQVDASNTTGGVPWSMCWQQADMDMWQSGQVCWEAANGEFEFADDCEVRPCAENEHVDNLECVACPEGTSNDAGDDAWSDDTSCADIMYTSDGTEHLTAQFWSQQCSQFFATSQYDDDGSWAILVKMGDIRDYFMPRNNGPNALCSMMQSYTEHLWTDNIDQCDSWVTPGYHNNHLGGSVDRYSPIAPRVYLSFWGSNAGVTGGCCIDVYGSTASDWGQPLQVVVVPHGC